MTSRYTYQIKNRTHKEITALGLAKTFDYISDGVNKVILLVPQVGTFKDTALGEIIDSLNHPVFSSRRLKKDHIVTIENSEIELVSSRDISKIREADVLFAYCSSSIDLEKIDKLTNIRNVIYIPWTPEEQEVWIEKWEPEIL